MTRLETRSIRVSRIEARVSSDCQLPFERYCISSYEKEMKSASGSMSSDENGPKGGIISSDQKEVKRASGSMSSEWAKGLLVSYLEMKKR